MGNLFGKPKEKKSDFSEKDRAVLELKRQRIRLLEYKKQATGVLERETAVAKQLLKKGDKKRAALTLKKKKYQQQLLDKTDAQLFNVEELVNSIEFAAVQQKVFEALKTGNTVLQKINDTMKIEDVEKLMEDSAEAIAHQNKVNELLGGELTEADNEAIEKELAAFEYEDAVKEQQQKDEKKKVESSPPKRRPSLTPIAVPPILLDGRLDLQSPAIPAGPGLEPATPVKTQAAIALAEAEHTAGLPVAEPPVAVAAAAPAAAPAPAAGSTPAPKRTLVLA